MVEESSIQPNNFILKLLSHSIQKFSSPSIVIMYTRKIFQLTFQLPKMEDTVQQQIRLSLLQMALDNAVTIEDYEECQQLIVLERLIESQKPSALDLVEAK